MATIVTRSGKGSPLTNTEVDANFTNLNTELGTKASISSLATVATTGAYSDLAGKPTNVSSFSNDSGYITGITSSNVTTALGFTPYDATNPSGYITSSALTPYALKTGVAFTGAISSTVSVTAPLFATTSSGAGSVYLNAGTASNTGYISFWNAAAVRQSYIGFSTTNSNLTFQAEGSTGFSFNKTVAVTGSVTASVDMRAPIFYDSNDTSYYVDPAATSVINNATFINNTYWQVSPTDAAVQRADARDDATNFSRLHWYGLSDAGATSNFRHAWYDGGDYINVTAGTGGRIDFSGSAASMYIGVNRIYADNYHPEADKWTTARTLSLSGDATGSVSWDGSANVTLPVAVVNDSHEHSFNSLLNKTGGTGTYTTSGDFRAPVFYDSNNTAYGVDPTGFSNLTTLYADRYFQRASGTPTSNLGDPTVTEMALFDRQFNNKTAFYPEANLKFFTSTDGITWTEYTSFTVAQKKALLGGDAVSGVFIPNGTPYFRIELTNDGNYVYLNALYIYWSASGNSSTVKIQKRRASDDAWLQHTNSSTTVAGWPSHVYLPFATIPYISPTSTSASHFDTINIDFQPTWANANNIALYNMEVWGGYPAGSRNIYTTDSDKNVTFPTILGANTDVRAPVFYDSNNTGFYFDGAGTSNLTGLTVANTITGSISGSSGSTTGNAATATTLQTARTISLAGDATGSVSFNGSANVTLTAEVVDDSHGHSFNNLLSKGGGTGTYTTSGDYRAPIFYDSNDTLYYANPNGTSNFSGLTVASRISGGISGDAQRLFSHTGANNGGLQYWNTLDNTTLNPSAGYHYGLRMAHGDADTYYNATIAVDFFADNFYLRRKAGGTDQTWRRFWHNGDSTVSATGDFRAPIFYDSDNTGFYADFASASANAVYTNGGYSISAGDSKGFRFWNSDDYKIYMSASSNATWGGRVSGETTSDYNMYFRMKSGTNRGFVFRSDTTNVAGIDATGRIYSAGGRIYLNDATTNFIIAQADVSSALYLEARGGGFRVRNAASGDSWFTALDGTCTATTDFRAPIFYDSNNTAFYVDPASGSNLNGTLINNGGTAMTAGWNRNMMLASTFPVLVFNSANTKYSAIGVDHSGAAAGMRFWVNATSADAVTGTNAMNINTGNFVEAAGSFRAPIFYDSDNTAYYTNPAGLSQMYTLNMGAGITADNGGVTRVTYPQGGAFSDSNNVLTGAIKIALPVSWTNTMMSLRIRVFDYSSGESFEVHCGGYNYEPSVAWINTFAYIVGEASNDRNFNIRFGHDGTKCCILIGEVGSTWSYLKVVVEDVLLGHSGNAISSWDDGWAISTVTALPTITSTRSNVQVGRFGNVFYDTDNTARFVDPSGTSSLTGLTVANTITGSVSGSSGSTTGNAATATTLQTARTINGVSFNGSANITITAAANGGNAATVGGLTPSASSGVGSRVVAADANGYIFNNYFNSTDNGVASGVTAVMVKCGDNYYRSATPAAIATFISGQVMGIAGNAATATSADQIDGRPFRNSNAADPVNADTIESNGIGYYTGGVTNFSGNATDGALYSQAYSSTWQHQIAGDYRSGQIALRGKNNGTWQAWRTVLDSSNYTSYAMPSGSSATNSVDVRAPIFYDTQNTGYYVDPNSVSRLNNLSLDTVAVTSGITGLTSAPITTQQYNIGTTPTWLPMTHQRAVYTSGYITHLNTGLYKNANAWGSGVTGWYAAIGGSDTSPTQAWYLTYDGYIQNSLGYVLTSSSFRAPIFYDSDNTGFYVDPNSTSNLNVININGQSSMATQKALVASNYGHGVYGVYSAERYQHVWSMGTGYNLPADGLSSGNGGNLYGLAWSYNPNHGYTGSNAQSKAGLNHQLLLMMNGITYFAAGNGVWTSGTGTSTSDWRAPIFYDSNDTAYYIDLNTSSRLRNLNLGGGSGFDASLHIVGIQGGNGRLTQMSPNAASQAALNLMSSRNASNGDQWWSWGVQTDNTWKIQSGTSFGGNGISIDSSGSITASGNVTAYSDIRIKANVETIPSALDKLDQIRGVTYTRIDLEDKEQRYAGVIAQEIEAVLPEAVRDLGDIKAVDYNATIALLIQAVKELRDEVEVLRK